MNDTLEELFAKHGTEEMFGPVPAAPLFSDESLALAFTQRHGDSLRYVAAWNRWLRWNGMQWAEEKTLLPFDLARAICRDAAEGVNELRVAKSLTSSKTVAAIVALARVDRRHAATARDRGWRSADQAVCRTAGTFPRPDRSMVDAAAGRTGR